MYSTDLEIGQLLTCVHSVHSHSDLFEGTTENVQSGMCTKLLYCAVWGISVDKVVTLLDNKSEHGVDFLQYVNKMGQHYNCTM